MLHFIHKRPRVDRPVSQPTVASEEPVVETVVEEPKAKNNKRKKETPMNTNFEEMEQLANQLSPEQTVKRVKKDKGLIERVESQKTILAEDNRQLLVD